MPNREYQESVDKETISKLFGKVAHLEVENKGINTRLDNIENVITGLGGKLDRLLDKSSNKQFNWGWFIGAVSFITTIGTLTLAPIKADVARNEVNHKEFRQATYAEISEIEKNIVELKIETAYQKGRGEVIERTLTERIEKSEALTEQFK